MLTPKEVAEHGFQRAGLGGYSVAMVGEFLDAVTGDYTALYQENIALKAKLKVLTTRVEEYRATESSMQTALAAAQEMARSMVSEAEERRASILADAEMEARARIGTLRDEINRTQYRLDAARAETSVFIEKARAVCAKQIEALETVPDLAPVSVEPTFAESSAEREAITSTAALGEKIAAAYDLRSKDPSEKGRIAAMLFGQDDPAARSSSEKDDRVADMMSSLDNLRFTRR